MLVGELSRRSGFSRDTIRFYEKEKLIVPPTRGAGDNNYKNYSLENLAGLLQIKTLKTLGFTLAEVGIFLADWQKKGPACGDLPARMKEKMSDIDTQMEILSAVKKKLAASTKNCSDQNQQCAVELSVPSCLAESCR